MIFLLGKIGALVEVLIEVIEVFALEVEVNIEVEVTEVFALEVTLEVAILLFAIEVTLTLGFLFTILVVRARLFAFVIATLALWLLFAVFVFLIVRLGTALLLLAISAVLVTRLALFAIALELSVDVLRLEVLEVARELLGLSGNFTIVAEVETHGKGCDQCSSKEFHFRRFLIL